MELVTGRSGGGKYSMRFMRSEGLTDVWGLFSGSRLLTSVMCVKGDVEAPAEVLQVLMRGGGIDGGSDA